MATLQEQGGRALQDQRLAALREQWVKLPPMATEQDAQARLQMISDLLLTGLLSGSQGSAAVRACEVWLKAEDSTRSRERVKELEKQLRQLERELAQARRRGGRTGEAWRGE